MSYIKKFTNKTTAGNEKAIKRGVQVPPNAVNLSWIETPTISPDTNMIIVDTSSISPADLEVPISGMYFSDLLGRLQDVNGNQLITDQYPAVTDQFSISGDISNIDLTSEEIFPFVHVSRFFHIDIAGLVPGTNLQGYDSSAIKVVDSFGNIYADDNGNPLFMIKIIPTYIPWAGITNTTVAQGQSLAAYRVYAFIDTSTVENLYLTYDKVELDDNGAIINQVINYKELLNPVSYFDYRPEEAEVVDPVNIDKPWYSSRSTAIKKQILGLPSTTTDGYEIVVPKKAIPDPRIFQLFRWRVVCAFTENFTVEKEVDHPINCGVIVTGTNPTSRSSQIFNILASDLINTASAVFANPLNISQSSLAKMTDEYWYVNFDDITNDQLSEFDFLVWAPDSPTFDFGNYLSKIQYFTNTLGKVMLVDTDSYLIPENLGVTTTGGTSIIDATPVTPPVVRNTLVPTSAAAPGDLSTWLPEIFLGLLSNITCFNPPPPFSAIRDGIWATGSPPSSVPWFIQYQASDGFTYWRPTPNGGTYRAISNIISSSQMINNDVYENTNPETWMPPIFLGSASSLPNATPPNQTATGWTTNLTSIPGGWNLFYTAADNNTYVHGLPNIPSYAMVSPAITLSGDIESVVTNIQSWYPSAYPNVSSGTVGSNVGVSTGTYYTNAIKAGALYNFSTKSTNLPPSTYAVTPTTLSYYLPTQQRNPVANTDNGATYNMGSNIFDASVLKGWTIDTSETISVFQTAYGTSGGRVQYLLEVPENSNVLVSGQIATATTIPTSTSINITETLYKDTLGHVTTATNLVIPGGVDSSGNPYNSVSNLGAQQIVTPTLPEGAVLSQIIITTLTKYFNAENGLTVNISSPVNVVSTGASSSSSLTSGVLSQTYTVTNGSAIDLSKPFNLTWSDGDALIASAYISVTFTYYTTSTSAITTTSTPPQAELPFVTSVPLMIESGRLMISTLSIPQSAALGITGAAQLLYNIALYATANRPLATFTDETYSSSFTFSSPWQNSWVINATDFPDALTETEKNQYDFFYLPEDSATPVNVWQRQLSSSTCSDLINNNIDPTLLAAVAGSNRTYTIEVSNSLVEVPSYVDDNSIPYAWTSAYTPPLKVPADYQTYILRETEVDAANVSGTYIERTYQAKPFACQVRSYADIDNVGSISTNWTASGTATLTYDVKFYTPPQQKNITVPVTQSVEVTLSAADHGLPSPDYVETHLPYTGALVPGSIQTYQDDNYYSPWTSPCWPFFGMIGIYKSGIPIDTLGCQFIQDVLNNFHQAGFFQLPAGYLPVDGIYGPRTTAAVLAFQQQYHAIYQNGITDAETFSIIGSQILRAGITTTHTSLSDYRQFYNWPYARMQYANVSDGNPATSFQKRTNAYGGPSLAWDCLSVTFDQAYNIHGITITPWVEGITPTMRILGVNALNATSPTAFGGFNPANMMLPTLNMDVYDDQPVYIPFNSVWANQVQVNIGQTGLAYSTANSNANYDTLVFGVRDIMAHATVDFTTLTSETITIPGYNTTDKVSVQIPVTAYGTADVSFAKDYSAVVAPIFTGAGTLSNITWQSLSVSNSNLNGTILPSGLMSIGLPGANGSIVSNSNIVLGEPLPGTSSLNQNIYSHVNTTNSNWNLPVFWMTPDGSVSPVPETGMISKVDGIKLLCDSVGNPIGFPALPTSIVGEQIHYVNLSINTYGTDPSIQISFYDVSQQEFITDSNGLPQITYSDYISRGPHNIYVGVVSTFEVDTQLPLPSSDDAPSIPNVMVMPAYGVQTTSNSRISIGKLPGNLDRNTIWPIPVKTGSFTQSLTINTTGVNLLTGYLSKYEGTTITAYYSIPEAENGVWSSLYGPPNVDIAQESPILQDLSTIQVRQPPILMNKEPTIYNTLADPVRPVFTVYTRDNLDDVFSPLSWSDIEDYNVSNGTIYLKAPLASMDSNLITVDYTSEQNVYAFKELNGTMIDLNPYASQSADFIGKPIYVYIVPTYITNAEGIIAPESQQTNTLRYSFDTSVFDPLNPLYDPTAVQLGIIYISTSADINDLVILDSRRRGGGTRDGVTDASLTSTTQEAINYWDVSYGTGMSYQNGCFIMVRLPVALQDTFTAEEVNEIIRRNLGSGVQFGVQDTEGNDW